MSTTTTKWWELNCYSGREKLQSVHCDASKSYACTNSLMQCVKLLRLDDDDDDSFITRSFLLRSQFTRSIWKRQWITWPPTYTRIQKWSVLWMTRGWRSGEERQQLHLSTWAWYCNARNIDFGSVFQLDRSLLSSLYVLSAVLAYQFL